MKNTPSFHASSDACLPHSHPSPPWLVGRRRDVSQVQDMFPPTSDFQKVTTCERWLNCENHEAPLQFTK